MWAIETENLTKSYRHRRVVDKIDLKVRSGSAFGFIGPNGAGKTTTIRVLIKLVTPDSGKVRILGRDLKSSYNEISKRIAGIVENLKFFPNLNAIQTMRTFSDYCNLDKSDSELEELLEKCGILYASKRKVNNFSLGMKQRLGIAAALINSPKVIILDEPANGLDPEGMASLRMLLRQLASDEKRTIFVSSHLLNEIEQICDEIAIINEGRIEAIGEVRELLSNRRIVLEADPRDKAYTILSKSPLKKLKLTRALMMDRSCCTRHPN